MQISALLSDVRFRRTASITLGVFGWIGLCCFGILLVIGERGPSFVLYALAPALLSLGLVAAGSRFWRRHGDQRPSLGSYVAVTFLAAVVLAALILGVFSFFRPPVP